MQDPPLRDIANNADELNSEMMRMSASELTSSRGLFVLFTRIGKARTTFLPGFLQRQLTERMLAPWIAEGENVIGGTNNEFHKEIERVCAFSAPCRGRLP
jgi:hypothetical protein